MKIAIVGSGNVGGALGTRWVQSGHEVIFSSRNPQSDEMKALVAAAGPSARASDVAEAVAGSEVILLATPWGGTRDALARAGNFTGKILLDATNPLLPGLSGLELGTNTSGAEQVAQWAPGAKVVKIFNTVGFGIMENPKFGADQPLLFYCGDDAEAKKTAGQLATELGFDAQDAGPLTQARMLEPLALLWISLAFSGYGWDFAFKLIRR